MTKKPYHKPEHQTNRKFATLTPQQIADSTLKKAIAMQLHRYLNMQDNPPAKNIDIPVRSIKIHDAIVTARVTYTVVYCGEKTHTVNLAFAITPAGHIQPATMRYI